MEHMTSTSVISRCLQCNRFCPLGAATGSQTVARFSAGLAIFDPQEVHITPEGRTCVYIYEVWQKNNETDFLLSMNFILFTNQGYPLQNNSLGQLHSDGDVVSIVRSSAGRLLLEYLSARRLRSSGCYPKYQNGALSSSF